MQKIGNIPNTRADSNGEFTDGNVAGGVPPTILPAEWFNTIQRELMSILTAAEIESDSNAFNQVLLSIQKLVSEGIPELKDASLTQKGIVQLSSATNSTSETLAATPKAVKAALDASLPAGGTAKAAEKLATARKISGVDFDGTKDITLPFINTTDTNIQLAGNLGVKNLEVHPMGSNPTEGGQIDLYDKDDARAAFIDIDSGGNFRVVTESLGVTLSINRTTGDISVPKSLIATGDLTCAGLISKGTVYAGDTKAWLAADGNIYGPVWGGYLSTYLSNRTEHRVRAWAAVQGNGTIIHSFGFAAINRTNVGGYNFTMSTSNGAYAVTVGINGGSQNVPNIHSANIWNRSPNSFSIQNARDGGVNYDWTDWPEFYVIVVGP